MSIWLPKYFISNIGVTMMRCLVQLLNQLPFTPFLALLYLWSVLAVARRMPFFMVFLVKHEESEARRNCWIGVHFQFRYDGSFKCKNGVHHWIKKGQKSWKRFESFIDRSSYEGDTAETRTLGKPHQGGSRTTTRLQTANLETTHFLFPPLGSVFPPRIDLADHS